MGRMALYPQVVYKWGWRSEFKDQVSKSPLSPAATHWEHEGPESSRNPKPILNVPFGRNVQTGHAFHDKWGGEHGRSPPGVQGMRDCIVLQRIPKQAESSLKSLSAFYYLRAAAILKDVSDKRLQPGGLDHIHPPPASTLPHHHHLAAA